MDSVPISSISAVSVLQRVPHSIHFPRDRDEMNMVRHQTVADQCQAVQLNALSQQIEINLAISIGAEDETVVRCLVESRGGVRRRQPHEPNASYTAPHPKE